MANPIAANLIGNAFGEALKEYYAGQTAQAQAIPGYMAQKQAYDAAQALAEHQARMRPLEQRKVELEVEHLPEQYAREREKFGWLRELHPKELEKINAELAVIGMRVVNNRYGEPMIADLRTGKSTTLPTTRSEDQKKLDEAKIQYEMSRAKYWDYMAKTAAAKGQWTEAQRYNAMLNWYKATIGRELANSMKQQMLDMKTRNEINSYFKEASARVNKLMYDPYQQKMLWRGSAEEVEPMHRYATKMIANEMWKATHKGQGMPPEYLGELYPPPGFTENWQRRAQLEKHPIMPIVPGPSVTAPETTRVQIPPPPGFEGLARTPFGQVAPPPDLAPRPTLSDKARGTASAPIRPTPEAAPPPGPGSQGYAAPQVGETEDSRLMQQYNTILNAFGALFGGEAVEQPERSTTPGSEPEE